MPKTKELIDLFRAIGRHDLTQAASMARKLASEHGSRGQFRAQRDLLGALNGAALAPRQEQPSAVTATWTVPSALMPLSATSKMEDLELPSTVRVAFTEVIKEWRSRVELAKHRLPRRWRLLFHGPSGCGKSASAAALAAEVNLPGFLVRFDSLIGAFLGQTALRLRELFYFAEHTPCVLLFDEVDALAKRRGSPMEVGELDRIVIAFMQEMEHARGDGFVIATSNIPRALDDALWRRFDLRVAFPTPKPADLERFGRRRAENFGLRLSRPNMTLIRKVRSYADAEQIIVGEARRRVLSMVE